MPIYHGLTQVNKKEIIHDSKQMSLVYVGDKLVWQKITIVDPVTIQNLFPNPVAIVNEEVNSFITGTLITVTAIDTINHTISLSWLPPYLTLANPIPGKEWIVTKGINNASYPEPNLFGQDQSYLKIVSGNIATKTLTYNPAVVRNLTDFSVGTNVALYNIFNTGLEYNGGRPTPIIQSVAGTYYSEMTGSGAIWKHSDGTFRMAVNGNDSTKWQVGLWSSANLLDWTFVSTTPLLALTPGTWHADGLQINSIIENDGHGFIAYGWGKQGSMNYVGWVKFDENMENVSFSPSPIVTGPAVYGVYNPNVIYYKGEYRMLISARFGEETAITTTPWEVWECVSITPEGPFIKRSVILHTTEPIIRNTHECYRSSHTTSFGQFILNGVLCAFVDGTSMWNNSVNRGERQFGLMSYDEQAGEWKDYQKGIIVAGYQFGLQVWNLPNGHLGGTPTMIKHDNKLYIFLASTQVSNSYQTVLYTLDSTKINSITLPLEVNIPLSGSINTTAPTVSGFLSVPGALTTLKTDLVTVYEMDDVSGTVLTDSFGSNNGAIQTGLALNQAGLIGKSIQTDPTTRAGYVIVPHNVNLNPNLGNYSINTWIKWTGTALNGSIAGILTKGLYNAAGGCIDFMLRGGGGNAYDKGFYFRLRTTTAQHDIGPSVDKTSVVGNGAWHMITLTIDMAGSPMAKVFLDKVQVGSFATITADINPTMDMNIFRNSVSYPMKGFIDQTAFWKKALTQTEIDTLYNAGAGLSINNW